MAAKQTDIKLSTTQTSSKLDVITCKIEKDKEKAIRPTECVKPKATLWGQRPSPPPCTNFLPESWRVSRLPKRYLEARLAPDSPHAWRLSALLLGSWPNESMRYDSSTGDQEALTDGDRRIPHSTPERHQALQWLSRTAIASACRRPVRPS